MLRFGLKTLALLGVAFTFTVSLPMTANANEDGATLYDDLGGKPVMDRVISDMLDLALADPKMAPIFVDSDLERLERLLIIHTCHIADGPCQYEGQDMRRAHDGLGIQTKHFNRLVENLQAAMDGQGIPFRTQNRLLARLAPFHDDVTERSAVPPRTAKPLSYSTAPLSSSVSTASPGTPQGD
jgi:hemoglobin